MGAPGWQEPNSLGSTDGVQGCGAILWTGAEGREAFLPRSLQEPGSDGKSRCNRIGKALSVSPPGVPECPLVV